MVVVFDARVDGSDDLSRPLCQLLIPRAKYGQAVRLLHVDDDCCRNQATALLNVEF